ncbi:RNA exonuclease 4 [Paramyrothecium foliicola]|nr:RNA exonuclease 4 [Paramyrothecium foliicola]
MAELSSNWKKLQAKLKSEATSHPPAKRKFDAAPGAPSKKIKVDSRSTKRLTSRKTASSVQAKKMGGVQSSKVEDKPSLGPSPSLALWAADNDISAETLAEAYDLGLKSGTVHLASEKDKINHGLTQGLEIGKYVAMDCEMVGVGPGGYESALARVSIVDFHGRQVYDSYVKSKEVVTDWRTAVSGISRKEMRFARDFEEVQQEIYNILKDRVLIGHDIKHDLAALMLSHPPRDIRDTAKFPGFKKYGHGRKPALRNLAREILGVEVQSGAHSSIEDARVTMLLFRKHKSAFDMDFANRYAPKTSEPSKGQSTKKGGKKKRKP